VKVLIDIGRGLDSKCTDADWIAEGINIIATEMKQSQY